MIIKCVVSNMATCFALIETAMRDPENSGQSALQSAQIV